MGWQAGTDLVTSEEDGCLIHEHGDGSVRQLWETAAEEGQTWAVVFDGLYVRN